VVGKAERETEVIAELQKLKSRNITVEVVS
jgi:hypothetical protein